MDAGVDVVEVEDDADVASLTPAAAATTTNGLLPHTAGADDVPFLDMPAVVITVPVAKDADDNIVVFVRAFVRASEVPA